ncbi:MAG: hypothetical protein NT091_04195 [Candidatus Falkowbacteria bacterium]|nr:hypothetical protein [Candidatus Falkowbacteria bacterium]
MNNRLIKLIYFILTGLIIATPFFTGGRGAFVSEIVFILVGTIFCILFYLANLSIAISQKIKAA